MSDGTLTATVPAPGVDTIEESTRTSDKTLTAIISAPAGDTPRQDFFSNDFEVYLHTIALTPNPPPRTGPLTVTGSAKPNTLNGTPLVTVSLLVSTMALPAQTSAITNGTWSVTFNLINLPAAVQAPTLVGKVRAQLSHGSETATAVRSFTFASS